MRFRFIFFCALSIAVFLFCGCVQAETWWKTKVYENSDRSSDLLKQAEASSSLDKNGNKIVAKIVALQGLVSVKRALENNWLYVDKGAYLHLGDKVFVQERSALEIEYLGVGASLLLDALSFTVIGSSPPQFSRFKSKAGLTKKFGLKSKGERTLAMQDKGERTLAMQEAGSASEVVEQSRMAIKTRLEIDTDNIPVLFPEGNLQIFAHKFPAKIQVDLEQNWNQVGLWAFLWSVSADKIEPEYVGFKIGSRRIFEILKPGEYQLQLFSEDETRTTAPILISARPRKEFIVQPIENDSEVSTVDLQ